MNFLILLTGLSLSAVAAYYSIIGLIAIFPGAAIPVAVMGVVLEIGKLVTISWLYQNWQTVKGVLKYYLTTVVVVLMLITSMGIFGFLSKAHNDQSLVSGDVLSKVAVYDEKIKTAKENIESARKQLKQMDEAVDQTMARSTSEEGATKANNIRKSQQRDRSALAKEIETNQKLVISLNDEAAPIRAEVRKVEAEVGPIKYVATFLYGETDPTLLEKAVTWVIILIILAFDPLAVSLLIAYNSSIKKEEPSHETWEQHVPAYTYADTDKPVEEEKGEEANAVTTDGTNWFHEEIVIQKKQKPFRKRKDGLKTDPK